MFRLFAKILEGETKMSGLKQKEPFSTEKASPKTKLIPRLQFVRPNFENEAINLHCEITFPECHACELIENCPNWISQHALIEKLGGF